MSISAYRQIEIQLKQGDTRTLVDCAAMLSEMAVTRAYQEHLGWAITHLPTSFCLPWYFPSAAVAIDAMSALDEFVLWDSVVAGLSDDRAPNCLSEISRVCKDHGGKRDSADRGVSADEIKARLGNPNIYAAERAMA